MLKDCCKYERVTLFIKGFTALSERPDKIQLNKLCRILIIISIKIIIM